MLMLIVCFTWEVHACLAPQRYPTRETCERIGKAYDDTAKQDRKMNWVMSRCLQMPKGS